MTNHCITCTVTIPGAACFGCGTVVEDGRAELADVRILSWRVRSAGHPTTWAWDTHDELVALWCHACDQLAEGYGDRTWDNDICQHCGSEDTTRVIANVHDNVLRGL